MSFWQTDISSEIKGIKTKMTAFKSEAPKIRWLDEH